MYAKNFWRLYIFHTQYSVCTNVQFVKKIFIFFRMGYFITKNSILNDIDTSSCWTSLAQGHTKLANTVRL